MALEFVADIALGGIRFIGWCVTDLMVEYLCKKVGYVICRPFNRDIDSDGITVFLIGLLFWLALFIGAIYWL